MIGKNEATEWLTVQEAAAIIGVEPITIRRAINRKQLKAAKIGGRTGYRIRREDLEAYMEARTKIPAA